MPITSHPKAASLKKSPTALMSPFFSTAVTIARIAGGLMNATGTDQATCRAGQMNDSGLDSNPMMRAREKFSVARDERNMPSSKREKDVMS